MDNNWSFLYDLQVQRHQEDLAIAEQYRLAKQALPARNLRGGQGRIFFRRVMYALGSHLMSWGCRLQSLYE